MDGYRPEYAYFEYEKWKICNVVLEAIINETQATLEFMYYGDLCYLNVDDIWDLFESLASYQWNCECASEASVCPSPPPPDTCSYCQSFDHDVNSCPSYVVFNDSCARLDVLVETIKEQQDHFVSEMREFSLLHETDPSLPIPRLESSLYDHYESSLPLESNIVDNAPLTDLEEVFDPPLTYSPLVAPSPSSTPLVTSTSDSTLLDSPFPLAQCTGLEVGEISGGDVRTLEDVSLSWSKEFQLVEPHLEEAPFVEFYGDLVMGTDTLSTGSTDPIGNESLDLFTTCRFILF